ncbi:MAG: polyphosphate kinase 1 [Thermoanaerobaculia bacterium]
MLSATMKGESGVGEASAARGVVPPAPKVPPITHPPEAVRLFNREFSWLEFNRRVLAEAQDESVPLLERLKFLSIASNNLDEFLMVRVGAIRELVASGVRERSVDDLTPKQQLKGIRDRVKLLMREMYACFDALVPQLRRNGISIESSARLTKKQQALLADYFHEQVAPVLTPLAFDPGHPFPFLASRALNLAIVLGSGHDERHVAFVRIPSLLRRFVPIPGTAGRFLPIERLIEMHVGEFFPGLKISEVVAFRVIRNADIALPEDEVQDLLKSLETELRRRDRREVVWVEIERDAGDVLHDLLEREMSAGPQEIFFTPGPPKLNDLSEIYTAVSKPSLKDEPFNPRIPVDLATSDDIFSIIRRSDVLLHRPYDSFSAVVEFVQAAADDPDVVAIKQTLYRTEAGSVVVEALARAAERGKQVTAIVELQARFDEEKNIAWARRLEQAGVQVVYGLVGIKTHCKVCLVVRREDGVLKRYVHLSTGNYNARTATIYTDIDLLTGNEEFAGDAAQLLNLLTGYSIATVQDIFDHTGPELRWNHFVVSPMDYQRWVVQMIEREIANAAAGKPAQILAKLNSIVDATVIGALYRAAAAGVKIDLIVRGICCLVPGDNIRVVSIVDRFLEHTRILLFRNGGETEVYVASGDWMPRNFFRRVEVAWPILDPDLSARVEQQILATCLADDVKSWRLQPDGSYKRKKPGAHPVRSQERFIEIARSEAVRLAPYDQVIVKAGTFRRRAKRKKKKDG